ncbi:hypothetical protein BKA66DRAFT_384846, partial [Pyrenochaeta sp. MPI-SDFR-AT-0127]
PTARRSTSSSRAELRSRYHNPGITSASLQQQLVEQTKPADSFHLRSWQVRHQPPLNHTQAREDERRLKRQCVVNSTPNPELPKALVKASDSNSSTPLKPCMKKKAKSATNSPPNGLQETRKTSTENRTLRRVKTFDFEENGTKSRCSISPFEVTSNKAVKVATNPLDTFITHIPGLRRLTQRVPPYPSRLCTVKSSPADPAVTRTDVHVIAIAPWWSAEALNEQEDIDPTTPTMQIVESKNGCYEVIWDDVPAEHTIRLRRRSSSASHALETVDSTAIRGLERVNTKLADWSGTWNSPPDSFRPTIVVFPDDDGLAPRYDCAVEEDEDLVVWAPPNSHRTSGTTSRLPSRSVSAPNTRSASQDETSMEMDLEETPSEHGTDWALPKEAFPLSLEHGGEPARIPGASRRIRASFSSRKLSNIDDADIRFRGHRDSVTIAHSRLVHSKDLSPDLFAHQDSISVAKQHMHTRNHATPAAKELSRTKDAETKALEASYDDDASVVSLPILQKHAACA